MALKQDGQVSCHYIDSWRFVELPAFLQPENSLKNTEMAMEDDYGNSAQESQRDNADRDDEYEPDEEAEWDTDDSFSDHDEPEENDDEFAEERNKSYAMEAR